MKFHKYPSITNSYSSKFINYVEQAGYAQDVYLYAVQEKIHGANFAIYVDRHGVDLASRNNLLKENDSFYNVSSIREQLEAKANRLWEVATEHDNVSDFSGMIIHGELCGGAYPDIKSQQKAVQKGVFYSPKLEFFVFDITAVYKHTMPDHDNKAIEIEAHEILELDIAQFYAQHAGFNWTPILFEGTMEECLKFPNEFNSGIPQLLSLPELEENICEGVVIKPFAPLFLKSGSRVIMKNKNDKFSEKAKVKKEVIPLSDNLLRIISEAKLYVTEPRYDNVTSKMDAIDYDDKGMIGVLIKALTHDVFEEINRENPELFDGLAKSDQREVNKAVSFEVKKLILKKF